ncbi:MAG: phage portal protein [Chloroflexota bacterium]|nr:phage portal protein [Chloroflexota bacterium]
MIARANGLSDVPSGPDRAGSPATTLRLRDSARLRRYQRYQDFYEGRHFERARPGRTSLVLNYARAIVDKGVAYLLGRGVGYSVLPWREEAAEGRRRAEAAERLLYDVYWDNDVEAVDLRVAQNAAVLGDGVYKVFWDALEGRIRVLSVDPATVFVSWAGDDPTEPRRVEVAYRLSAAEAEELFATPHPTPSDGHSRTSAVPTSLGSTHAPLAPSPPRGDEGLVEVVERWTTDEFQVLVGERVARSGPNPYGAIPFVHVPNLPLANETWGVSDLVDVIPINREIDERVSDQADIIRFHADPPVIFKGVNDHTDLAEWPTP